MKKIIFLLLFILLFSNCELDLFRETIANDGSSQETGAFDEQGRGAIRITNGLRMELRFNQIKRKLLIFRKYIKDESGRGNDGYVQDVSLSYGWDSNSAYFDGSNSKYIYVEDSSDIDFGTGDFSIACWVKPNKVSGTMNVIDKRDSSRGYHLYIWQGRVGLQLADGTGGYNYSMGTTYFTLRTGQWYHIVVTVDRDNTQGLKIFVDGMRMAIHNPTNKMGSLSNSQDLLIGKHKDIASYNYRGRIDQLLLYNRALSETEARQIMYPGVPAYLPSYWNNDYTTLNNNNCYNYAANKKTNTFAQPGNANGINLGDYFDTTDGYFLYNTDYSVQYKINKLKEAVAADGLQLISDDQWFHLTEYKGIVALVYSENTITGASSDSDIYPDDYHFYRLNPDKVTWSHKPGNNYVSVRDGKYANQNLIFDPKYCDRHVYTHFVGYYKLWSDSNQGAGHEYIR